MDDKLKERMAGIEDLNCNDSVKMPRRPHKTGLLVQNAAAK